MVLHVEHWGMWLWIRTAWSSNDWTKTGLSTELLQFITFRVFGKVVTVLGSWQRRRGSRVTLTTEDGSRLRAKRTIHRTSSFSITTSGPGGRNGRCFRAIVWAAAPEKSACIELLILLFPKISELMVGEIRRISGCKRVFHGSFQSTISLYLLHCSRSFVRNIAPVLNLEAQSQFLCLWASSSWVIKWCIGPMMDWGTAWNTDESGSGLLLMMAHSDWMCFANGLIFMVMIHSVANSQCKGMSITLTNRP